MKKFLSIFIFLTIGFFFIFPVSAKEGSDSAVEKYKISFPITELGNCNSLSECKAFCADLANQQACINFAKKKGFYKQEVSADTGKTNSSVDVSKETLLKDAKGELGCDSEESCRAFCGQQANWEKCGEFARKHKLSSSKTDPTNKEILYQAKELLGCSNYDQCKNFCQKPENSQRCNEFAKLVGLKGGEVKTGTNGESISQGGINPKSASRSAFNTLKARKEQFEMLCSQNPQKCEQLKQQNEKLYGCYKEGKAWNGKECSDNQQNNDQNNQRPTIIQNRQSQEAKCKAYGGTCEWADNYCKCQGYKYPNGSSEGKISYPKPVNTPYSMPTYAGSKKCQEYGCSWNGNSCTCNFAPKPVPAIAPIPAATPVVQQTSQPNTVSTDLSH